MTLYVLGLSWPKSVWGWVALGLAAIVVIAAIIFGGGEPVVPPSESEICMARCASDHPDNLQFRRECELGCGMN